MGVLQISREDAALVGEDLIVGNEAEWDALKAIAADAKEVCTAYAKRYEPSRVFEPEIAHLEQYVGTCWETLMPMIKLGESLDVWDKLEHNC